MYHRPSRLTSRASDASTPAARSARTPGDGSTVRGEDQRERADALELPTLPGDRGLPDDAPRNSLRPEEDEVGSAGGDVVRHRSHRCAETFALGHDRAHAFARPVFNAVLVYKVIALALSEDSAAFSSTARMLRQFAS